MKAKAKKKVAVGAIVSFVSTKRGHGKVTGEVVSMRVKHHRKRKQLAQSLGLNDGPFETVMWRVVPLDRKDIYWDVPENMLTVIKPASGLSVSNRSLNVVTDIKHSKAMRDSKLREENFNDLLGKSLDSLRYGHPIEVQYRDAGWKRERFSHYTKSGKIAFISPYTKSGVRYVSPSVVRVVKVKRDRRPADHIF